MNLQILRNQGAVLHRLIIAVKFIGSAKGKYILELLRSIFLNVIS